jgi:TonB family protein
MELAAPQTQTTAPTTIALAIPHAGEPPRSYKLEIPAASAGTNGLPAGSYTLKVLPPATAASAQTNPDRTLHVSPGVIAGSRINFAEPIYPDVAKKAKLNGTVVLDAIIGKDGKMKSLHVLTSTNPMFNNSAMEAVQHWTYKPYLLNGQPTEVDTTITVNYALTPSPTPEPSPAPNPSASNSQSSAMPNQAMHIGGNIKKPIVIYQTEPEYSQQAKDAKFSGDVEVYLVVDTNGRPSHVRVVRSVGMGLDEKAVQAVRQYRFKPATLDGKPVPVDLYIDVNFAML